MVRKTTVYEKNGWVYIRPYKPHPKIEKYRQIGRTNSTPENIVELAREIPEFSNLDCYPRYVKWVKALQKADRIKKSSPDQIKLEKFELKYEPMQHQRIAIAFSLSIPACGLFMETGTGKTFVALMNAHIRKKIGRIEKTLVIAPPSIITSVWKSECEKFTDLVPVVVHPKSRSYWNCPVTGIKVTRLTKKHLRKCKMTEEEYYKTYPGAKVLDGNKIKLIKDRLDIEGDLYITSPNILATHIDEFISRDFGLMIIDESTMIKSPNARRTKAAHKIGRHVPYKIILTGTPITNNLEDIWSQMYFVDQCLGPTFNRFIRKYFWTHPEMPYIRNVLHGADTDIINIISKRCIRFRKAECLDLPEQVFVTRDVEMTSKVKSAYNTMHDEMFALLEDGTEITVDMIITRTMKLQQIVNSFVIDEDQKVNYIDKIPSKIKEVKSIMEELRPDQKVIIWCIFKHDMKMLCEHLKDYNPVLINSSNVDDTETRFKEDPECRIAISHPKSCRFGHNWTHSDVTIYYSMSYSVEDYVQSIARNYRKGQEKSVTVFFIASGPIDHAVLESVTENKNFGEAIVDDRSILSLRERLRL